VTSRLLIVAASRSGTRYACRYLAARFGLTIGHERIGPDGAAGWPFLLSDWRGWDGEAGDWRAAHAWSPTVHQVRQPLATISSMMTHVPLMMGQIARDMGGLPEDPVAARMGYWLEWQRRAESETAIRYRVEDLTPGGAAERLLADRLGLRPADRRDAPPTTENTRKHPRLTWEDLDRADADLASAVRRRARAYGYETG